MSAPAVNSLPPAATASSLPLPVSPVKINPPSPPVSKPPVTQNHAPSPLSLVNEKAKTPEKHRDLTPPTSNGLEEPSVPKEPVLIQPEEAPPAAPAPAPIPPAPPTINHSENPPTAVADKQPEPESAVTEPIALAAPAPVPAATAEPEPATAPPKPAKPQGAKRRREPASTEAPTAEDVPEKKSRRTRAPVHHYQSPLPEITTVINRSLKIKDNAPKSPSEKLVIFFKNEFLAVRSAEGFYLCQTMQNIFKSSHRIRIRWLSMDEKEKADDGGIYTRDFYDTTDFECILTNVALKKEDKNKYKLPNTERDRVENILKRGLEVEQGVSEKPAITEDHPDGIDISLYRDESQLQKAKKITTKRKAPPAVISSPKVVKKSSVKPKESKAETKIKSPTKAKVKSKKSVTKPVAEKPTQEKEKPKPSRAERTAARDKKGGPIDPPKVSPPNEKARVVAKILRKLDPNPAKGESSSSDKKSKSASKSTKKEAKKEKKEKSLEKVETKKSEKKSKPITLVTVAANPGKKPDKDDKKGASRRTTLATRKGRK